jgi:hypothetical protein
LTRWPGFGHNKVDLNSSYATPLSGSYGYVYDKDRRLKQVNSIDPSGLVNWYRVVLGVGLGLKAVFTAGVGVAAIAGTASVTGNPVLTAVVAVEMIPVFAVAVMEAMHAFEQI